MSFPRRRRRHDLTLADKMNVIRMIDNRTSQTDVAKVYGCSQSQISRIVSRREDILHDWKHCKDPAQKKQRLHTNTPHQEEEPTVVDQSTSPRPPSDGELDASKSAGTIHTPTTGGSQTQDNKQWVEYWKQHSSSYGRRPFSDVDADYSPWSSIYGRKVGPGRPKLSANKESRISNQLLDVLKCFDLCDVYCADELALYYDAMPNINHPPPSNEEAEDEDMDKKQLAAESDNKRLTVFLTCNVTGSDKRNFVVVEDSKKPSSTSSISGCHRAMAPNAWMTADIFKEYLVALDYDMRKQGRYILLLVDNAAAHVPQAAKYLEHVRVLYVRSYSTPFFHGLFYEVRAHYRKQVLLKLLANNPDLLLRDDTLSQTGQLNGNAVNSAASAFVHIDFVEAVSMLKQAWSCLKPQEIVQCFSKAGLCAPHIHGLPDCLGGELPDLPEGFLTDRQFQDYVNLDIDVNCCGDAELTSTQCRILTDLREQGFTDIDTEPSDDLSPYSASESLGINSAAVKQEPDTGGERSVPQALAVLHSFLQKQGLHLHNLHALEAQISSCLNQSTVQKET